MPRVKGQSVVEKTSRSLTQLAVEYVPIESLSPNSWNPNRQSDHDFELLVRSMMDDGFTQPIVAVRVTDEFLKDKAFKDYALGTPVITDGEHRWTGAIVVEALRRAGVTNPDRLDPDQVQDYRIRRLELLAQVAGLEIPVVFAPMTPSQMRVATLRHNRARGSEDIELTGLLLRDLEALGALDWAQEGLMLDDVEIQSMMEDVPAAEVLAGAEYSEAWQVAQATDQTPPPEGANVTVGMTQAAVERMRVQERAVAVAHNDEERAAARRDNDVYRISLVFSGDEAKTVRSVLGDRPADRMLELCRTALPAGGTNGHAEQSE